MSLSFILFTLNHWTVPHYDAILSNLIKLNATGKLDYATNNKEIGKKTGTFSSSRIPLLREKD